MCKTYQKAMVIIVMLVLLLILGFGFETEKVEAATAYGTNLVVNGNGEASGTVTDYPGLTNYAGWTSVSLETDGTTAFIVGHNSIFPDLPASPNGGNFFDFFPEMIASDTLYQTIDISDIFTDVDSGYIVCDLKGYLKKFKAASSATIVLEMLDSGNHLLSSYQLIEDSADDSDDWVYKDMMNIPVNTNTRKFRISLNASISNISPTSDYIEFDGIELSLKQVPVINVKGNNINIANNDYIPDITDHTDFGSADITSGSVTRTFVIENNGKADLRLYGASKVAISGTNASDFTVTTGPSSPVSAGGNTAFDITFNPSAVGVRNAIITIENNGSQSWYTFSIKGTGTDIQNITAASVQITAPVLGADPQNAEAVQVATNNADFTVTDLTWNEALTTGGKFKAGRFYTATVTLTSKNGKKFQSEAFTPTVAGSASVGTTTTSGEAVGNTVSFIVTYAATGELTVNSIAVTAQPTKMSYIETTDGVLALNGMQITEVNNDGSTRIVSFTDGTAVEYTSTPANGTVLTNSAHNGHPVTITHTVSGKAANTNNLTVAVYVPPVTVPGAPTIGIATAGDSQATVSFSPAGSDGGAEITGYTVTSNPGGYTGTGTASPITVTGLTNGTEYTFSVTATNTEGTGAASVASNSVTPSVAVIDYNVWVGGIRVTSANMRNITGDGIIGTITYNPDIHTLTLNGATICTGYTNSGNSYGIYTDSLLNLELVGNNRVAVEGPYTKNYGVYANGALNISGNGELNVTASTGNQENIAIYSVSDLNISGGTITAISGNILGGDGASYGIYAGTSFTISGGTITASCGNATVYYAIYIATLTTPIFSGYTPLIMAGGSEDNALRVTTPIESYHFADNYIRIDPSYAITYRPGTHGNEVVLNDYKIHASGIVLRGATFTRTGYTQTGWATSDGGAKSYELEDNYSVNAAIELYPVWTIIVDSDIATVDAARTAAYNATYLDMTQASVTTEASISNALKTNAEAAVNDSSVTTTINKNNYTEPVAGTSANPNGTNGTYTFTITVAKGIQSQTTEQRIITILATPFIGATDTEAVEAAKTAIVNGTVNVAYGADQSAKTAAVQTYVNSLINSMAAAAGVTGTVTYSSGNTYSVAITKGSVSDTKTINMTINEADDPSPTPIPDPDPEPTPTPTPVKEPGIVEKDKHQDEGAPAANVNSSSDELKTSVLTPGEQQLVARGENAKIILKVTDISSSISEEEKKLIKDKMIAENKKEEKETDDSVASDIAILYVDLTLYKQVGIREQTKVTETNDKISISLEIPEEFWNTDVTKSREFYIMRIHEGEITRIDGNYDAIKQIFTFETDRFSTYALTYQDTIRITTYEGFRYLQLRVKTDKTSQILSYKRNGIVDGYLIFGGKCGEEMVELADIPAKITSYVIDDLMPRTFYKYQVKAYRIVDGERIIIMTSKVVHSILNGKTYADPKRVTLDMTSIKLTKGENKVITGQLVLPKGKKLKAHTTVIRFESSNSEIASVNSKGKITGKTEGSCYVYAYAQNGVYKRIKVTVK